MVMLKDTHLDAAKMDISQMLKYARDQTSFSKKIEIEVEKPEDAILAFESNADIIMFDNMTPENIKSTIVEIKKICEERHLHLPVFEASGNITLENFEDYSKTGVNIISTSEITMFPPKRLDVSLKIQK
jgi:nicotinate-nucleotide pyrophosphorylase (carboxylating)